MIDVVEKMFQAELRIANKHLPVTRKSLAQLLSEIVPHVVCRDGSVHVFRRSELKKLREHVKDEEAQQIFLPIIIHVRADMDTLTGFVENELEATVIRRILGLEHLPEGKPKKLFLYKPQLYELRYRFSTIFQIAIVADLDSVDTPPTDSYSLSPL
ncbi:MAG: DUF61 family protein [Desulfurococcaceae archaeon]